MDIIGDSTLAFEAYVQHETNDDGMLYLTVHGLFQTIAQQLSACLRISQSLNIKPRSLLEVKAKELKEIRNIASGHPDEFRDNSKRMGTSGISRVTLNKEGFTLVQWMDDDTQSFNEVNIKKMLITCARVVRLYLIQVINHLVRKKRIFSNEWNLNPLTDHIKLLGYYSEKLGDGLRNYKGIPLNTTLDLIECQISNLTSDSRYTLDFCRYLKMDVENAQNAIQLVRTQISIPSSIHIDDTQLEINVEYLQWKICEIDSQVGKIDQSMRSDETTSVDLDTVILD